MLFRDFRFPQDMRRRHRVVFRLLRIAGVLDFKADFDWGVESVGRASGLSYSKVEMGVPPAIVRVR